MKKQKVLIIDDNHLIRYTTTLLLRQINYEPLQASNAMQGLEIAIAEKPDVILLDIMMPDMDGWELLRIIEKDERVSNIPIIIFTALEEQLFPPESQSSMVKAILQKPFHLNELTTALQNAMPPQGAQ